MTYTQDYIPAAADTSLVHHRYTSGPNPQEQEAIGTSHYNATMTIGFRAHEIYLQSSLPEEMKAIHSRKLKADNGLKGARQCFGNFSLCSPFPRPQWVTASS